MNLETLCGYTLTSEEVDACKKVIEKMRAESLHQAKIKMTKYHFEEDIAVAIKNIGLDETKRILRELNRKLRDFSEDNDTPFN